MAHITHDDLMVCEDCAQILANGEFDGECEHGDAAAHTAAMVQEWGELLAGMVLDCDEDCECSFSWSFCRGCGSRLGGSRYAAVVLAD